jgi:hypothetical protein
VWAADAVISAGGTMNREAAVLGVPTWTTFAGQLGAVDRWLIEQGRLRVLERAEDLVIAKREPVAPDFEALADAVTEEILRLNRSVARRCPPQWRASDSMTVGVMRTATRRLSPSLQWPWSFTAHSVRMPTAH